MNNNQASINTAVTAAQSGDTIKLNGPTTGDIVLTNKLVNIDLNNKTLTGDVSVTDPSSTGTVTLTSTGGAGVVTGTLTVNTPNADFVVGTGVTVTSGTTIIDVYGSTFTNNGTLSGDVQIDDMDASFVNAGNITGDLIITSPGSNVRITATNPIPNVIVTGAGATVEVVDGTITTLTSKAAGVKLTGTGTVTTPAVSDGGTLVDAEGAPVEGTEPELTPEEVAINAINEGTATAEDYTTAGIENVTEENLIPVRVVIAKAKSLAGTDLTKSGIQEAVDGLVSFTATEAFATETPFLSLYVLNEGGVQVPSNAGDLEANLKTRLVELQAMDADVETDREIDMIQHYVADDVKFYSGNIMFSADKKTIYVTGPLFNEASLKVAKGAKTAAYKDPFNITLVKEGFVPNQPTGSIHSRDKLAKIQISQDGTVNIIAF